MARITLIVLLSVSQKVWANSCCGQTPASFLVLEQQQKWAVALSASQLQTEGRVFSGEDFYIWPEGKKRVVSSLGLTVATQFQERLQFFLNTHYLSSNYSELPVKENATHLSDTLWGASYELLPEYTFSYWRPVVYVSWLFNLPTGKSIYAEDQLSEGAAVTGHQQWGTGVGITLRKTLFPFTLLMQGKVLRLKEESFGDIRVSGFYDTSFAMVGSWATGLWGTNASVGYTWNRLSSRMLETTYLRSSPTEVSSLLLTLQKVWSDELSVFVSYMDQTLLGRPQNTLLNKSYSIGFNYNFF